MIFVEKEKIEEEAFLNLLEQIKVKTLEALRALGYKAHKYTGDEFETLVYQTSIKASQDTEFEGSIVQTGAHTFPDIIVKKYFGIEVKMTTADKWISTGNSILETTRVEDIKNIYLFFGKLGGKIDIRYRSYSDCLFDIGVTHSPRYKINMELTAGNSIFDKMSTSYEALRQEKNPIKKIKEYYRGLLHEGEELWWIDPQGDEQTVAPIIKPFRFLPEEEQDTFIAECFILFPEILGKTSSTKYERAAAYLITKYNAVHASLRDSFSANGKINLVINGTAVNDIPQVYSRLLHAAKKIDYVINHLSEEELLYYWKREGMDTDRITLWKEMINAHANFYHDRIKPSDIYEWGLQTTKLTTD